jgi:ascorbate-specific PTS system EIIC-type component UlaA
MKATLPKIIGLILTLFGMLVVVFSNKIVFPGLERLVGIETIVGTQNVVYQPDGSFFYTNPGAMMRWIIWVASIGLILCLIGIWVLIRARRIKLKPSN